MCCRSQPACAAPPSGFTPIESGFTLIESGFTPIESGFTLIEMVMIAFVMALVAAVAMPTGTSTGAATKVDAAAADVAAAVRFARDESSRTGNSFGVRQQQNRVRVFRLDGGTLDGLLHAQSVMLRDLQPAPPAAAEGELSGTVVAGERAVVVRSQLAGPVLLGDGVTVEDCRLGPGVVVGDGAMLRSVRLRRALVAPGARLEDCDLEDVVVTASGQIAGPGAP